MEEIVEIVDANDQVIGQKEKSLCHTDGDLHRVSAVLIFNSEGKLLLHKRGEQQKSPGKFDHSAAGHLEIGESYLEGAKRELQEELGITCELNPIANFLEDHHKEDEHVRHMIALYIGTHEGPFNIQESEVASVAFETVESIQKRIEADPDGFCLGFKLSFQHYLEWKNAQ